MSRIKINLLKLQNIINFIILTLKNKLRYFSVYLYYKTSIERIVKYRDQIIYIVCDNKIINPTYGDFLYFVAFSKSPFKSLTQFPPLMSIAGNIII